MQDEQCTVIEEPVAARTTQPVGVGVRAATRVVFLVVTCAWLAAYGFLKERVGNTGGARDAAFLLSYVACTLAVIGCTVRAPDVWATVGRVVRAVPIRSVVFVLNVAVAFLVLINVATYWGLIGAMGLTGVGVLGIVLVSASTRRRVLDGVVRYSSMSFVMVYLLLGACEVLLRFNPMLVGGGGGGNPALRQLYAGLYSMNSQGLRNEEFPRTPPDGTFRILALGDSFTFGQGVPAADTYPRRMEAILNETDPTMRYEVINAGKPGVGTVWELDYLRREGLSFEPDLVTLQFYLNDISDSGAVPESRSGPSMIDALTRPRHRSYVLFFLWHRFASLGQTEDFRISIAESIEQDKPAWRACAGALDAFGALSRERGIPIVVVLFPHAGQPHPINGTICDAVARRSRQAGLHVVSLVDAFDSVRPDKQVVSRIDHHPGPPLHHIAAERIVAYLRTSGVLRSYKN